MRSTLSKLTLTALLTFSLSCSLNSFADNLPVRKAGLWEISMKGMNMPAQTSKQCIDEKTDEMLFKNSTSIASSMGGSCQEPTATKTSVDTFEIKSLCNYSGSQMNSTTTFKGDFSSSYDAITKVTYNPPFMGMSNSEMTFNAKWLGKCEAGQVPGDIIMSNGVKMNINVMQAMQKSIADSKK